MARPVRPRIRSLREKTKIWSIEYVPVPESMGIDVEGIRNAEEVNRVLHPPVKNTLRNADTCLMYGGGNKIILIAQLAVVHT